MGLKPILRLSCLRLSCLRLSCLRLSCLLGSFWWCGAQSPVQVPVFTNVTAATQSSAIKNIGQSQHIVYYQLLDNGGSCAGVGGSLRIEASYNNSTWFGISPTNLVSSAITGGFEGQLYGNGTFPYIRLNQFFGAGANCKVNAWYTGAITSNAVPAQSPSAATGQYLYVSANTGTSPVLLGLSSGAPASGVIQRQTSYAIQLSNRSAANDLTVDVAEYTDSTCAVQNGSVLTQVVLAPRTQYTLQFSGQPWLRGSVSASLAFGKPLCVSYAGTAPSFFFAQILRVE